MNVYAFLISASFGLFSLSVQAFSCELPLPDPAPSESSSPTQLLPRLSDTEIAALQTELTQGIDTWFGLAGVAKVLPPPPLTNEIQNYRAEWSAVNPDVATFLGSWIDDEGSFYSLNIFPAQTPGQVCVLEFRPKSSLYILNETTGEYVEDVLSDQLLRFSVATVQDGHLRSSEIRSVGAATAMTTYGVGEAYPVLFMSLMEAQGSSQVVALASPPALPSELPEDLVESVSQTLDDHGCITALAPSVNP